jgi:hypothetical protein
MLRQKQIDFLDEYTVGSWSVNPATGLVDIDGDFLYEDFPREVKYPLRGLRFEKVTGDFIFEPSSYMTDLDGFPQRVGKNFSCSRCHVESLKGGPIEVGGSYRCSFNKLKNFEYAPKTIPGDFVARFNHDLESFDGLPKYIGGDLRLEDGNPWQMELDVRKLITVYKSEIKGRIKFGGLYSDGIYSIQSLAIPGIDMSDLLRAMDKRGIL